MPKQILPWLLFILMQNASLIGNWCLCNIKGISVPLVVNVTRDIKILLPFEEENIKDINMIRSNITDIRSWNWFNFQTIGEHLPNVALK
jgi:hypothetical protein